MKTARTFLLCTLAFALAGLATVKAAEDGRKEGKATVRAVHGKVEYLDNGNWLPVRPNMRFDAGVTIRTGANGTMDISVNGTSSAVRLTNNTTLQIPTMYYVGSVRDGDQTTMLNLVTGSVLGNVKKISANSRYEITTPHGVAGVRGTDFAVEAVPTVDKKWVVTFKSITGVITVSAVIDGITVTHTLTTGTQWVIGEAPKKISPDVVQNYQNQILGLLGEFDNGLNPALPHPTPNLGTGPGLNPIPGTTPFPNGGQPQPGGNPPSQ